MFKWFKEQMEKRELKKRMEEIKRKENKMKLLTRCLEAAGIEPTDIGYTVAIVNMSNRLDECVKDGTLTKNYEVVK